MIGLLMLGSIINYLTRSTLAVAAPTLHEDLQLTEQQYSWIVGTFQGAIMLQPFCGYVMDVIGLKLASPFSPSRGRSSAWRTAWLTTGRCWPACAACSDWPKARANPAGMKATAEWFPAKERGFAGGLFNIGASVGSMLAPPLVGLAISSYNWQTAFVITGPIGLVWASLWLALLPLAGQTSRTFRTGRDISSPGRRSICRATAHGRRF